MFHAVLQRHAHDVAFGGAEIGDMSRATPHQRIEIAVENALRPGHDRRVIRPRAGVMAERVGDVYFLSSP